MQLKLHTRANQMISQRHKYKHNTKEPALNRSTCRATNNAEQLEEQQLPPSFPRQRANHPIMPKRRRQVSSGTQSDMRKPFGLTSSCVHSTHEGQLGQMTSTEEPLHRTSKPCLHTRCSQQSNVVQTPPLPVWQQTKAFAQRQQP